MTFYHAQTREATNAADEVIAVIEPLFGVRITPQQREQIAQVVFDEGLLNGDNDITLELEGMPDLRFIQEDHYDQHMDEDGEDYPAFNDQIAYVVCLPCYVWVA